MTRDDRRSSREVVADKLLAVAADQRLRWPAGAMRAVLRIVWLSATLASAYMPLATPRSGIAPLLRAPIPQPASRGPRLVASAAEPPRPDATPPEAPRRTTLPVASAAGEPPSSTSFELYDERWLQLGYLSLLALLSAMGTDCSLDFNSTHDARGFRELHVRSPRCESPISVFRLAALSCVQICRWQ